MPERPSDKYIPLYFVAFFAVVFAVNAVFVYIATSTNPEVITENPYEKGLEYNKTIELAEEQEASGEAGEILLNGDTIIFSLKDNHQQPIVAKVFAKIVRPTQKGVDYELHFESDKKGLYISKGNFPLKGLWDIEVEAKWQENGQNKQFQKSKRVVIN